MTGAAAVVFDDDLTQYDFGLGHPMAPIRVDLTMRLAQALGVLDLPDVTVVPAPIASDEELMLVHDPGYIAAVREMAEHPLDRDLEHGLGTEDNPLLERDAPRLSAYRGSHTGGGEAGLDRRRAACGQHQRRAASRDGHDGERLLHLQRPRHRDRVDVVARRRADRVHRHRRAPWRGVQAASTTTRASSPSACMRAREPCSPARATLRARWPGRRGVFG